MEITIGERTLVITDDTSRLVAADAMQEAGRDADAALLRDTRKPVRVTRNNRVRAVSNRVKVRLTNDFHGSSVVVVGENLGAGEDNYGNPVQGTASVRLTESQRRRVLRSLCGASGCLCGQHGPRFEEEGRNDAPTCTVTGELVRQGN